MAKVLPLSLESRHHQWAGRPCQDVQIPSQPSEEKREARKETSSHERKTRKKAESQVKQKGQ